MRKQILVSILLGGLLLSLSFTKSNEAILKADFALVDSLLPVLPEIYFNYDIEFPTHILESITPWNSADLQEVNNLINPRKATLGRVLFYDKLLSVSNEIACASCHKQAFSFADNQSFSEGVFGTMTTRNSPNLNDLGWAQTSPSLGNLFWDCRASNLDSMVLLPIVHQGEMGKDLVHLLTKLENTAYYPAIFEDAFGTPSITQERIAAAIASFVRSMAAFDTHYDKVMSDLASFTPSQRNGFLTFQNDCASCHDLANFSTLSPSNTGLDSVTTDAGVAAWYNDPMFEGAFRSPSLRNIVFTAPYMHDGRFATLDDVIDFYSEGILPHPNSIFQLWGQADFTGFAYTEQEKLDLKHFLLTLTDSNFITDVRFSDPFSIVLSDAITIAEDGISIAPNPFDNTCTVRFGKSKTSDSILQVLDANGQLVKEYQIGVTDFVEIKRSDLPKSGVYWIKYMEGDFVWSEKLVLF